ncbi:MAG: T9SS type A sorting domain-containing protein [Aquaticitalea sp.]
MQKITIKNRVLLSFILLCIGFSATAQEMMFEVSLNDQVANSSKIVEGKVISKNSFWDLNRQNIYTVNTIEVYKSFKGQAASTIEIISEGGVVGMNAQITTLSLDVNKGDIGVFMLYDSNIQLLTGTSTEASRYEAYSAVQGFYKYDVFENSVSNPYVTIPGISQQFYSNITSLSESNVVQISPFDIDSYSNQFVLGRGGIAINSFSPETITGGTGSVLTINGNGFGSNVGSVLFRDANSGGTSFYTAFDSQIVSWSDTQILVEVPSRAGTGIVRVVSAIGPFVNSTSSIQIPYSEINVTSNDISYPTQHVDDNGDGGYLWSMSVTFFLNTQANQSFTRAFDTWRCETGINWDIAPTFSTVNTIALDNTNIIRFDSGSELPNGTLGRNTSYFSGCSNGNDVEWYISELDIVFNDTTNWQFGEANPTNSQYDFETVAVHELGHGHQLAHVINNTAIMHYAIGPGSVNRNLSANDILGGNDVQTRSTTNQVCGRGLMTPHSCSLGIDDNDLSNYISIYPNPAKNEIFIKNIYHSSIEKIEVYDATGRLVKQSTLKEAQSLLTIDTSNLSTGVYIINIDLEGKTLTKKMIID